ncbi:MAG: glycosyl hydrolase family 79 C-terminal domain-containing protein, partial [Alphaproteobacteria bacterium]|nr:glycosyl hydrolase family 79 C-terminal domain-containing protein [Alphaproteobacteria bacterium]
MQQLKEKILHQRISFEWGAISLLSLALFFVFQIINAEASNDAYFATSVEKAPSVSKSVRTTVNVNESKVLQAVPKDYIGFSKEPRGICGLLNSVDSYPKIEQEFKNLGSYVIRMGGIDGDFTVWSPDGDLTCGKTTKETTTINRKAIDDFFAYVKRTGGKAIWQVNLGANDPKTYADEANYMYKVGGSSLLGIEIGNEPERFVVEKIRPSDYNYSTYKSEWEAYAKSIKALGNIPIAGPDGCQSSWFKSFASDESSRVSFFTMHAYPTKIKGTGTSAPTIDNLLSQDLMSRLVSFVSNMAKVADKERVPLVLGETNSVTGAGKAGVSDAMAAALWGTDYMFNALEQGVIGIDFHGILSHADYAPINSTGDPKALYYAMLLFHNAAPNGNSVSASTTSSANVVSHAVLGKDGKLRVVVINKDLTKNASVEIGTQKSYVQASALYLSAPSIESTTGFTYGGKAVAADGTWTPDAPKSLAVSGNTAYLEVPAGSAAVVTLEGTVANKYPLTVKNGTGSGLYAQGTKVTITANA